MNRSSQSAGTGAGGADCCWSRCRWWGLHCSCSVVIWQSGHGGPVFTTYECSPTSCPLPHSWPGESRRTRAGMDSSSSSKKRPVTSLEALDLVDRPNPIDVALVPGGVKEREYPNTRQVTELALDPMHLLVRAELSGRGCPVFAVSASISGRQVGRRGSGPRPAPVRGAESLAAELEDSGNYIAENRTPQELARLLARLHGRTAPSANGSWPSCPTPCSCWLRFRRRWHTTWSSSPGSAFCPCLSRMRTASTGSTPRRWATSRSTGRSSRPTRSRLIRTESTRLSRPFRVGPSPPG